MSLLFDPSEMPVQRNDALEARRFGRLYYSKEFLETGPVALQRLFSKIIPTEVKFDFARGIFEVTAICDDFDPVEPGYLIPFYAVHVKVYPRKIAKNGNNKAYCLFFEKIEA